MTNQSRIIASAMLFLLAALCTVGCVRRAAATSGNAALFAMVADDLDNQLNGAQKDGLPQNEEDLRGNEPKPSDNAALVYASVRSDLKKHWADFVSVQRLNGPPGCREWSIATKALPAIAPELTKVESATKLPACWESKAGLATNLKQLAKTLCAKARIEAFSGNISGACETLTATWRLADHATDEPSMSGFINSMGIKRLACWTAQAIITDTKADRATLVALQRTFQALTTLPDARPGFFGNFVLFLEVYRQTLNGNGVREELEDVNDPHILVRGVDDKTLIRAYVARTIEHFRKVNGILKDQALTNREKSLRLVELYKGQWKLDETYRLVRATQDNADIALNLPMAETWRALLLNGISLLLASPYGHAQGSAALGTDPYTGGSFQYTQTIDGFRLSSAGVRGIVPDIPEENVAPSSHVFVYPCKL